MKNCPNLERLFLKGNIEANPFFINLSECLQTARHLRDLRYFIHRNLIIYYLITTLFINRVQWPSLQEDLSQFPSFFKALKRCPTLKRLVLVAGNDEFERDPACYAPLQKAIVSFVKGMPNIVALCLTGFGFPIDDSVVEDQLTAEIVRNRPGFWFHVGSYLPIESDLSVPRIHYDGIVNPMNPYNTPPRF